MIRRPKKLLALVLLPIVVTILLVPMLGGRTSASEVVESHEAVEAQAEHTATAAEVGEHDAPATAAGEHDNNEQGAAEHTPEEPWWKFTGWEAVFAALSSALFLIILRWLPLILEDKTGEGTK